MVEIEVGPNLLSAGAFLLSWHGLFSFIAVATAVYLVGRWAPMRGILPDTIYSMAMWAIIGGVVGARLVHVVDQWDFYRNTPGQIIAIWNGGIGLWGGILGGFVGGAVYAVWARQPVGVMADLTPASRFWYHYASNDHGIDRYGNIHAHHYAPLPLRREARDDRGAGR